MVTAPSLYLGDVLVRVQLRVLIGRSYKGYYAALIRQSSGLGIQLANMGKYTFSEDLKDSEASVKQVIEFLKEDGCTDIQTNDDGRYDISYVTKDGKYKTAEVKHDLMWDKTGNVAIEYRSRGKASGIATSKADTWFYVLNQIYYCPAGDLRAYLIQHWDRYRRVKGGDNGTSDLVLLTLDNFLDVFKSL